MIKAEKTRAANTITLLKMRKIRISSKKGEKKKNLLKKPRFPCIEENGKGICLGVPSLWKPHCFNARCQAAVDPISSAVIVGVFPELVSAKRSLPYSMTFCIQAELPLTRAQCKAVKPS